MTSLYEILKASKTGIASDLLTALRGRQYAASLIQERELEGVPPLLFKANGEPLIDWTIYGNTVQSGTPTPQNPVMPNGTGDRTENLFSGFDIIGKVPSVSNGELVNSTSGGTTSLITLSEMLVSLTAYSTMQIYLFLYDENETFIGYTSRASTGTIRSSAIPGYTNVKYARIRIDNVSNYDKNVTLVYGSTAPSSYIPYGFVLPVQCGGVITPVYLNEPIRKIGEYIDYKSNSAEYRTIKKYEFTGTEADLRMQPVITATDAIQLPTTLSDYKKEPFICSHMPVSSSSGGSATHGFYGQFLTLCFEKSMGLDTLEKMQTYLQQQYAADTPVTVWYVLATPTTESIEAPEIPTVNGSNTFDVDTTLKPSKVYIKYKG